MRSRLLFGALAIVVGACSSKSGDGTNPLDACQSKARAYCAAWNRCSPNGFRDIFGGDESLCVGFLVPDCGAAEIQYPNAADNVSTDSACASALDSDSSCRTFMRFGSEPGPCTPVGSGTAGAPCIVGTQCVSRSCGFSSAATCGTCVDVAPAGGTCDATHRCEAGTECSTTPGTASGVCNGYVDEGGACSTTTGPCHAEDTCVSGVCVPRGDAGAACKGNDCLELLFCTGGVCTAGVKVTLADQGAACGSGPSTLISCRSPFRCIGGTCGVALKEAPPASK